MFYQCGLSLSNTSSKTFERNGEVPGGLHFGTELGLLLEQRRSPRVALEHAVLRQRVVPHHLLLHVQDRDVRGHHKVPAASSKYNIYIS